MELRLLQKVEAVDLEGEMPAVVTAQGARIEAGFIITNMDFIPADQALRERLFTEELLPLRSQRERTRLWTTFRTHY